MHNKCAIIMTGEQYMNKEGLSSAENNDGSDSWSEPMSGVQSSSEIDFEKRKQEIEALKLDIERAKLEAEKKRVERDTEEAGTVFDPIREEQRRIEELAKESMYAEKSRIQAKERTYWQLAEHNPGLVANSYETHASLDNLDDKSIVRESLVGTNDGNANVKRSDVTPTDATDTLNGLANRQSGRYSNYQDAAGKHIDNVLSGIDRKLDIIEKRNPNNSSAA